MNHALALSVAPWLKVLSAGAWEKFVTEFDSYEARGGEIELKNLLSISVVKILRIRLRAKLEEEGADFADLSSEDLRAAVDQLFAPRTVLDAYERLQAVSGMQRSNGGKVNMDDLLRFVTDFQRVIELCGDVKPKEKKLKKLFISRLQPVRLRDRVDFEEPEDLDAAVAVALDQCQLLLDAQRDAGMAAVEPLLVSGAKGQHTGGTMVPAKGKVKVAPSGDTSKAPGKRAEVVCHGCGQAGRRNRSIRCVFTYRGAGEGIRREACGSELFYRCRCNACRPRL